MNYEIMSPGYTRGWSVSHTARKIHCLLVSVTKMLRFESETCDSNPLLRREAPSGLGIERNL